MSPKISTPSEVDEVLKAWWQGDCALGPHYFAYQIDPALPVSEESRAWATAYPDLALVEVDLPEGVMVITQTCDIRRECHERHFIQVAPLIVVPDPTVFEDVLAEHRPQYATIPPLHSRRLAADLDRVFTIEKAVLASWERTQGCTSDEERRILGRQLARKLGRAALPDKLKAFMKPLLRRWKDVKRKETLEGATFRDLAEVRVQATPGWYGEDVRLDFWFILKDEAPVVDRSAVKAGWLEKLKVSGTFTKVGGDFTRYDLMKVSTYFDSDMVDLDQLSPTD